MLVSAEIRLFWFHSKPAQLESWFLDAAKHGCAAHGPEERTDVYLRDAGQIELGVKTRGENPGVEVKGLIATLADPVEFDSYTIPVELWAKWPSEALAVNRAAGVELKKKRWMRKFDTGQTPPAENWGTPRNGCNVEWTTVQRAPGEICWTLGFEAFGGLTAVEQNLGLVARLMQERNPPAAPGAEILSYPAWIVKL